VHVSGTDFVVLFFPSANTKVAEEAAYARDQLLTDEGRTRLRNTGDSIPNSIFSLAIS
jgi:hypothetical protein